ncbi:MAG: hypothetical protein AAGL69_15190 [Pseudomonadota bacterium]
MNSAFPGGEASHTPRKFGSALQASRLLITVPGRLNSPRTRAVVAAVVAFAFYAAWAAWANRAHGLTGMTIAALTQGGYSAVVTLGMTSLIEWLFAGSGSLWQRELRCVSGTVLLLVFSSTAVHVVAGTAEIWMTILPSWIFGTLYALIYARSLARTSNRNIPAEKS